LRVLKRSLFCRNLLILVYIFFYHPVSTVIFRISFLSSSFYCHLYIFSFLSIFSCHLYIFLSYHQILLSSLYFFFFIHFLPSSLYFSFFILFLLSSPPRVFNFSKISLIRSKILKFSFLWLRSFCVMFVSCLLLTIILVVSSFKNFYCSSLYFWSYQDLIFLRMPGEQKIMDPPRSVSYLVIFCGYWKKCVV